MSLNVCILTPNPADPAFDGRWSEVRDRMTAPLEALGVRVASRSWIEDPEGLQGFDLVLPLVTWGYHRDYDLWCAMTDAWGSLKLPFGNSPDVLRWNADKGYLGRLKSKGAPVVPTLYVDRVADIDLESAASALAAETLIVKPQVSASAYRTLRVKPGDELVDPPEGRAMVQPYLAHVEDEGELSLIYIAGRFSHAIRKVAKAGDFRVQPEWGGQISAYQPEDDVFRAAEDVLKAAGEPLFYARVDMVRDDGGAPLLMELELIEPDLYLGFDPERGAGFARAVRDFAGGRGRAVFGDGPSA
ncbi:MAG: transporter [Caulobacteraceae bacterium]|nr:transporter [Caulobacteraceae bacterium]